MYQTSHYCFVTQFWPIPHQPLCCPKSARCLTSFCYYKNTSHNSLLFCHRRRAWCSAVNLISLMAFRFFILARRLTNTFATLSVFCLPRYVYCLIWGHRFLKLSAYLLHRLLILEALRCLISVALICHRFATSSTYRHPVICLNHKKRLVTELKLFNLQLPWLRLQHRLYSLLRHSIIDHLNSRLALDQSTFQAKILSPTKSGIRQISFKSSTTPIVILKVVTFSPLVS